VSAGKVRRVGFGRWSKRKEAIFFEELAATANVSLAAEAAGVSPNAVFARRLKHPLFAAKWEAVVRTAKASIDLYLIEETRKTFDPGTLDTATVTPKVTIDQAIRISQLNAPKSGLPADPFADDPGGTGAYDMEDVRRRLEAKMERIVETDRREKLALGWSYDESFDAMVPPGYVRGPEYRPKAADAHGSHRGQSPSRSGTARG
jgi:hypothetical protein